MSKNASKNGNSARRRQVRVSQQHQCFCGRKLHSHEAWNEHKQRCANWTQPKENQS